MKNLFFTDREIQDLVDESKVMPCPAHDLLSGMKTKSGIGASHSQTTFKFSRNNGDGKWLIYLRLSNENSFDFSCGLGFIPKNKTVAFTLRRYNGKSHEHTNQLETKIPFYDFHIHKATERYQKSSYDDEHYAEPTDRYTDIYGAFDALLIDCKVVGDSSDGRQARLL